MSRFLLCVDLHPSGGPSPHPPNLVRLLRIRVRPRGSSSAPRDGILVTDGHSSDFFQATGATTSGRRGAKLREALGQYLAARLSGGGIVGLALVEFAGSPPGELTVDLRECQPISTSEFLLELPKLLPGAVRILGGEGHEGRPCGS